MKKLVRLSTGHGGGRAFSGFWLVVQIKETWFGGVEGG